MALDLCCYWCVCECFLALRNIADLKERAQHESFKLNSIWGQNEDCGLGDSISENSEKLLQRGRGRWVYTWFWERGSTHNQTHIFAEGLLRVTISHKRQTPPWRNLVRRRRCKNWAPKISSWKYLTIWRPVLPVSLEHLISVLHPELLSGGAEGQQLQWLLI